MTLGLFVTEQHFLIVIAFIVLTTPWYFVLFHRLSCTFWLQYRMNFCLKNSYSKKKKKVQHIFEETELEEETFEQKPEVNK